MKPSNSNPRNGRPSPTLCGVCGGQLTKDYCVPCHVKFLYDVSKWLDRIEEDKRKRFWLSRLGFALAGASRYLPGFDTNPIQQAIQDAHPGRAVQVDNKENADG